MRLFHLFEDNSLAMDPESRMARAKQQGFTVRAYHGTGGDIHEFSLDKGKPNRGGGHGPNFSDEAGEASGYAAKRHEEDGLPGNVVPVLLRMKKPFIVDFQDKTLTDQQFAKLTGGIKSRWSGEHAHSGRDVMDTLWKHYFDQTGDQKKAWEIVYAHFKKMGYDGFVFPDVPRDFNDGAGRMTYHKKIVVFDPKNVRSIFAAFDPSKSESAELLA
jgi:hypothetical protein